MSGTYKFKFGSEVRFSNHAFYPNSINWTVIVGYRSAFDGSVSYKLKSVWHPTVEVHALESALEESK